MRWKGRDRRPQFRDCVECGDTFEVEPGKGLAKTCSPECSREHRKKYQRAFALARYRENPEASKAKRRQDYAESPDAILKRNAKWARDNRESINTRRRGDYAEEKGGPVRAWRRQTEAADAD